MADHPACPECGAPDCRERFGDIIALEFEDPEVFGAVHHITVICYNLQHPGFFTDEALEWMRSSLRAVIVDGLSPIELRERARKQSKGGVRVRRKTNDEQPPAITNLSMTVKDIRTNTPDIYREDIIKWAKSILKDLKIE